MSLFCIIVVGASTNITRKLKTPHCLCLPALTLRKIKTTHWHCLYIETFSGVFLPSHTNKKRIQIPGSSSKMSLPSHQCLLLSQFSVGSKMYRFKYNTFSGIVRYNLWVKSSPALFDIGTIVDNHFLVHLEAD